MGHIFFLVICFLWTFMLAFKKWDLEWKGMVAYIYFSRFFWESWNKNWAKLLVGGIYGKFFLVLGLYTFWPMFYREKYEYRMII